MATATWLKYGITGITQADLDLFHLIQSGDATLKAEYQKRYGATWYINWGTDQDRTNALYLAALSDDARLASLASNPTQLSVGWAYSLHDVNRWRTMGATAFQAWLATVSDASAANYYAQVSGYTFSIVTPSADSTKVVAPVVSGTPTIAYPAPEPELSPVPGAPVPAPVESEAPLIDAPIPPNPITATTLIPNNNSISLGGSLHIPATTTQPVTTTTTAPVPPNPTQALTVLPVIIIAVVVIAVLMLLAKGR
jgi:hypothetical protein